MKPCESYTKNTDRFKERVSAQQSDRLGATIKRDHPSLRTNSEETETELERGFKLRNCGNDSFRYELTRSCVRPRL